jgi:hypothetical protein
MPLVVASCPPRTPLADDSFGAWVLKAQELAQAYDKCRAAVLGQQVTSKSKPAGRRKSAPLWLKLRML